jgi:hypothetical protein
LEGALRKLGVDPDTIVGNHHPAAVTTTDDDDEEGYNEDDYEDDEQVEVQPQTNSTHRASGSSGHQSNSFADDMDADLCTPFNVVAVPANTNSVPNTVTVDESLHSRTVGRLKHLDILEEVLTIRFFSHF